MSDLPEWLKEYRDAWCSKFSDPVEASLYADAIKKTYDLMKEQQKLRPISTAPKDVDLLFINIKRNSFYKGKVVTDKISNFGHEYIPIMPFDTPTHWRPLPSIEEE